MRYTLPSFPHFFFVSILFLLQHRLTTLFHFTIPISLPPHNLNNNAKYHLHRKSVNTTACLPFNVNLDGRSILSKSHWYSYPSLKSRPLSTWNKCSPGFTGFLNWIGIFQLFVGCARVPTFSVLWAVELWSTNMYCLSNLLYLVYLHEKSTNPVFLSNVCS